MITRPTRTSGLFLLISLLARSALPATAPAENLLEYPRPLVIGHRGFPGAAPENTLASFDRALAAGVDLVELDYHHSADGVPIVIHDGTLDRTTDAVARWGGRDHAIGSRTAAELTGLEAGGWFHPPFPGQRLPTLAKALDFIQARGLTLVERKGGDPETLARFLADRGLLNHLVVQSFDWQFLRDFHRLEPRQVLGALGPAARRDGRAVSDAEKTLDARWLDEVRAIGARVAVWNRQVDATAIREAHRIGLRVWVYTINEPELAESLLEAGVDGLISDNPAMLWRAIALHRVPAGPTAAGSSRERR